MKNTYFTGKRKIMKKSLLYGILILLLASMGQQAFGMKNFAKKAAIGSIGLGYAYFVGSAINNWSLPKKGEITLNEKTHADILNIVHEAYPELKNRFIKVVNVPKWSWATNWRLDADYIYAPYTDQEWKDAYNDNQKQPLIKESILHEASHILYHDNKTNLGKFLLPPLMAAQLYKTKKFRGPIALYIGYRALETHLLKRWQEYRADQDAIKRAQDPRILRAASKEAATIAENILELDFLPRLIINTLLLLDPHPSPKARAKYFAEAAQKLEEKQAQEKIKNGVSHD